MSRKIAAITGHLAMLQMVTAVSLRPIGPATASTHRAGQRPGPTASSAISRIIARVTAICSGRSFQNGRPSGVS